METISTEFFDQAACAKSDNLKIFLNPTSQSEVVMAQSICRQCTVLIDCHEYAQKLNSLNLLKGLMVIAGNLQRDGEVISHLIDSGRPKTNNLLQRIE